MAYIKLWVVLFMGSMLMCFPVHSQIPELVLPELVEGEQFVYLDSLLNTVQKEQACYYTLTYYHLGKDVWSLDHPWRKKKYKLEWSGCVAGTTGSPVPLNGVAKWFTKNYSRLVVQEQFSNGQYSGQTIIYDRKEQPWKTYDYEKKWNTRPWSLYYEKFEKGQVVKAAFEWYDFDKQRWKTVCTEGCYVSNDFRP